MFAASNCGLFWRQKQVGLRRGGAEGSDDKVRLCPCMEAALKVADISELQYDESVPDILQRQQPC